MREHLWRRELSDSTVLKASWSSQFDGDLWNIHRRVKCPVLPNPGSLYVYRNFHFFLRFTFIKRFLVEKAILRLLRLKIPSRAETKHGESTAVGVELSEVSLDWSALPTASHIHIAANVFLGSVAHSVLSMSEDLLEAMIYGLLWLRGTYIWSQYTLSVFGIHPVKR